MGRSDKLVKNISFIVIGNIGSKLMGFFMLPFYTNWLSPADYGTTDLLIVYANLLLNVVACDMSDAIYIYPVGATKQKVCNYYSTGFIFQFLCSIICMFVFWGISYLPMKNVFIDNIWFIYGILISNIFQKYTQDFCRGINQMSVFSFTGIVQTITTAFLSFLLIPTQGVYGLVLATIGANIATALFAFFYSNSYKYLSVNDWDKEALTEMLRFSIPLIPTSILWWLISGLNRPLLEDYVGLFALGLMAVAGKLPGIMNLVFNFFQQAWIVTVVEEYKKLDFAIYYNKMFQMIMFVQMLVYFIILISAKLFINLMTAKEFHEAWVYIPLLTISVIFSNASAFLGTIFSAVRQSKYTFYSVVVGGVAAVAFNFLLIPKCGLWGACVAICLSHLLTALSRVYYSRKFVKFTSSWYMVKQLLILMLAYVVILILNDWRLVFAYTACLLLYLYLNKQNMLNMSAFVLNKISKRRKR